MSEMFSSLVSGMFAKNSECKTNEETNAGQEPTLVEESNPSRQAASDDQLDLAFCVDCTASMGPYIASAQQNVRTIIQELSTKASVDTRFALIEYRDHPPQDSTFITREHDFTYSLDNIQNSVNGMSAQGGGDGPESVCCAYEKVLRLNWRESATKVVVHIADAPPHGIESSDGFPNGCPSGNDPLQKAHEMKRGDCFVYCRLRAALGTTSLPATSWLQLLTSLVARPPLLPLPTCCQVSFCTAPRRKLSSRGCKTRFKTRSPWNKPAVRVKAWPLTKRWQPAMCGATSKPKGCRPSRCRLTSSCMRQTQTFSRRAAR
ncbi:unnamed protein product [Heterosigma akashiwo]